MAQGDIEIYGAVRAMTGAGKAAYAQQVFDETQERFQSAINQDVKEMATNAPSSGNSANTDLDIADEQGNVLVQFSNGELKTKEFNSKETPKQGKSASEFDIRDEYGNVVVQFANGHIKTQKFDSENIEPAPSPTPTPTPSTGFTLTQIY